MLILIDGYNLIGPVAPPGRGSSVRWLEVARQRLIDEVATGLGPSLAQQTCIVFDSNRLQSRSGSAAMDDPVDQTVIQGITIEFSVGYDEADDRIEELITGHHTPKRLTVVSSDHRIQVAAKRRGALAVDGDVWLDSLADGRLRLAIELPGNASSLPSQASEADEMDRIPPADLQMDTTSWLRYFEVEDEAASPVEPTRQKPKKVDNPFPPGYGEDLLDG